MSSAASDHPSYVSHEALFHFVGRGCETDEERYDILTKVLSSGVVSHPPHAPTWGTIGYTIHDEEDVDTAALLKGELIVPNMVCFSVKSMVRRCGRGFKCARSA